MSTHKGSRSRINNHEAAREAWERIWGKKDSGEPPRAITDAKAKCIPDPPKQNERADLTLASATFPTTMKPGEANDKQLKSQIKKRESSTKNAGIDSQAIREIVFSCQKL